MISVQPIYAALLLGRPHPSLLIATSGHLSVARLLQQAAALPTRGSLPSERSTVQTIRDAMYFHRNQQLEPILVAATWIICSRSGQLRAARVRARTSATP
jgi:hypothetical protein